MLVVCHSLAVCSLSALLTLLQEKRREEREDIRKSIEIPLLNYLRMTVSHRDRDNASEHVQIATTLVIVKPLHVTGVDDQWFLEMRLQIGRQVGLTRL